MGNPYFNPEYQPYTGPVLITTASLFIVFSIVSVGLRFYARRLIGTELGIDDWITIPSMVICVGLAVTQIIAATLGGLGGHQELVNGQLAHTQQLLIFEKTKYTTQVLGTVGLWAFKLSVLFFFRRIFQIRFFRLVNNVFIGLTVAWGLAFTFTVAFQCWPVNNFWNKFEYEYADHCVDVATFYIGAAASDLVLDILICLLPIPHLITLKMPWRRKLAVGFIFLLGSIVVACGIVRVIIYNWVIEFMRTEPMLFVGDTTWYSSGVLFWHLTENVVGLVGCCLPTYRPLMKRYLPNVKLSTAGGTYPSSGGSKTRSSAKQGSYVRQQDDEFPLSSTNWTNGRSMVSRGDEEHALQGVSRNQILVQTEFRSERQ